MKTENHAPLVLDFGCIQANDSLLTNTFPLEIPKEEYSVCRSLTMGQEGEDWIVVKEGEHSGHESGDGSHQHTIPIPKKIRSLKPGDRVLVAWVGKEAVVIDILVSVEE